MTQLARALIVVSIVVASCKSRTPTPEKAPESAPVLPEKKLTRANADKNEDQRVRATIATWVAAQNQGDFAAYERSYAAKFHGVKRSGPRVRRFNRAGWMADRKRMFAKPMQVSFEPAVLSVSGTIAFVEGEQHWASARYKDQGRKRLLLHREDAGWRIANEEMLQSKIDVTPPAGGLNYLAVYDGSPVFAAEINDDWLTGEPARDGLSVLRRLELSRLPAEIAQWHGKTLRFFSSNGGSCTAKISGFRVRATADWHFGSVQSWESGEVSEDEIIEQIWAQGVHLLEAIIADGSACPDGVVAFDASQPASKVAAFSNVEGDDARSFIDAAAQALSGASIEEAWVYQAGLDAADTHGATTFTHVASSAEACTPDAIGVNATVIWRGSAGKPRDTAVYQSPDRTLRPGLLIDLDRDGDLELIYSEWPRLRVGFLDLTTGNDLPGGVEIPFYDCPC